MGYCLLYPEGLFRVDPYPAEVSLVPEITVMASHSNLAQIEVSDAAGRSVSQVAAERIAQLGFDPGRSSLTLAGEEAVVLADVGGQASSREVLIVHEDRLYRLGFILPNPEDSPGVERFARFYDTVINSFTFVPISVSPQALPEKSQRSEGSAVVAFVKNGDVLVWEEATGQTKTIFDSGDVIRVELSHDGQLVAFVRRSLLDGNPRYGRSVLWVVDRDGANPRELVSDEQLRARLGASETDDTNFPELAWIPNSHRLLYSVNLFPAYLWTQGAYLLDADTLASIELAPAEESVFFMPSPDGKHIALFSSTGPFFVNVDDSLSGEVIYTYPAGGVPGPYGGVDSAYGARAWTQDSRAVLIKGSIIHGTPCCGFTIWRVPFDGAPPQPMITLRGDREQLAPNGSVVTFVRGTGQGGVSERLVVPLPDELGPLAVLRDDLGLSWAPGGPAYVLGLEEMFPLCPNAAQVSEVCEPPIRFSEPFYSLEWLDRNRFLYVTYVPRRLMLGSLDGSLTVIAEDPQEPPIFVAVAATCIDDSEFVTDVTVRDGTPFAPDTHFLKTWRVRNSGTCTWDASYRLTFLAGDRMSGPRSVPLADEVQPGEEVDLSVMLVAPESPGTYEGQWQLFAQDGTPFGTAPYVVIQVP